jgi:hypothetical protein
MRWGQLLSENTDAERAREIGALTARLFPCRPQKPCRQSASTGDIHMVQHSTPALSHASLRLSPYTPRLAPFRSGFGSGVQCMGTIAHRIAGIGETT